MCVLNVFYCKIAFVATKLPVSFMYVVGSLDTVVILNCVVSCSWLPLTSCPRRVSLCRNIAFIAIKGRALFHNEDTVVVFFTVLYTDCKSY